MTTKADYSEEEWDELVKAPIMAGVIVITADLHVTSMMGEMTGMMKAMLEQPGPEGAQELVGSLVGDIKEKSEDKEKIEQEFGDLLFSMINAARLYGIDPENALEKTNKKFIKRFNYLEDKTIHNGRSLHDMSLDEMNEIWDEAKKYD